ncbi:uncharacterized protein LOC126798748 isoform X3 [Argentina anserina]|uniref:uncharacterized protein LOC126798748 isoform X3 n=1 Tax=Argentina anserina TaxID=57926 RepID=UPI0021767408|nr:uncharacterized protein LOC126798748 isoform X3 [Potentilla anserina]
MDQLFSAKPKGFRIHRKSRLASKLKASISAKLSEFLGDYSDDVFLEYVTVLVCNGKDQYQAREDLEAFLGERSEEFVSWLWNYLDEVPGISHQESDRNNGAEVDRCTDFRSHVNKLLRKGDKVQHSASDSAACNDMKLAKGTRIVLSEGRGNEIPRRCMATGDIDGEGDRRTESKCEIAQMVKHKCSGLPRERLHLPEREALSGNTEFYMSGSRFSTQICAGNKSGVSLSQRSIGAGSILPKIYRGSVWDRLGKPCEDMSEGLKSGDLGAGQNEQYEKIYNHFSLIPPKRNPAINKKRSYSYHGEMKKLEHINTTVSEPHFASNIGRKRLFGQISTSLDTGSALVDQNSRDRRCKDTSQKFKKSNVGTNDMKTIQNQELLDVKEKLNQIEIEMSKLRSKKVEFENDGKTNHLLNSGAQKDSEETVESRTVLVTNQVHFAATREALSLYFSKCGVVVNVMILTDTLTSKPKGSAYVTFASKESADKAVALSGATFLCRNLKILRMGGAVAEASAPTQLVGSTSLNTPSKPRYMRSTLRWRREPGTVASEHSRPASVGVSFSAHDSSEKDRKTFITRAP